MTSCTLSLATREAAHAAQLAQRAEALVAAGQELVGVGLVAGVPDDAVAWAVEHPVERDRELDDAQRAAQVAAGLGDGVDDGLAQLRAQGASLGMAEALEVSWVRAAPARLTMAYRSSPSSGRRSTSRGAPPGPSTSRPTRSSATSRSRAQWSCRATPRS